MIANIISIAVALFLLVAVVFMPLLGATKFALIVFLAAATVLPWPLVVGPSIVHYGVTSATPVLTTYGIAIVMLLIIALLQSRFPIPWKLYCAAVVVYFSFWMLTAWTGTATEWSGALHYMLAVVAIMAGTLIAYQSASVKSVEFILVCGIAAILAIELAVNTFQLLGIPLSAYTEVTRFMAENRPIGTFNHPGTLGRFVCVLMIPLLVATSSVEGRMRTVAWFGILVGLIATAMTLSRANTIAVVASVVLWALISRRSEIGSGRRAAVLVGLVTLAVPLLNFALARFAIDASGGDRPELLATGLKQIAENLFTGTGPNNYVEIVGAHDPLTASGYPVHNTYLLAVAELGLIGGVIFFAPLAALVASAVRHWGDLTSRGTVARAVLATLPGVLLITLTGWGMLTTSSLLTWWFVVGYAWGKIHSRSEAPPPHNHRDTIPARSGAGLSRSGSTLANQTRPISKGHCAV